MSKKVKQSILHSDVGEELYAIVSDMAKETHLSKSRVVRELIATSVSYFQKKDTNHAS